jgi:hypothetical protein
MKNNSHITLAILALLSLTANAETLNNSLSKCAKIQDGLARLVCFDNLAEQAETPVSVGTKPSKNVPEAKAKSVMAPAAKKVADFGVEHLKKSNVTEEDLQVVFTVEKLSKDQYGQWRITFKNGQQWKQTDSAIFRIKVGESVLLKIGFMNSVYLKRNKPYSNKKIRIKRLK